LAGIWPWWNPAQAQPKARTFPETGKTVSDRFLDYWVNNGGLAQQGFPISEEFQEKSDLDGKDYTVQYFERAVFEKHPETASPNDVQLSQLGTFQYNSKYPNGAPDQKASTTNPLKFAETGKSIGGRFREYWEAHGGLAQQGFPISEEFTEVSALDGKPYLVQYFERAVFEMHPENAAPYGMQLSQLGIFQTRFENQAPNDVLLSQLGTTQYQSKYPNGAPTPVPPRLPTPAPGCASILTPGKWKGPLEEQVKFSGEGLTGSGAIKGDITLDVVCNGAFTGTAATTSFSATANKGPIKVLTCTATKQPAGNFNGKQEARPDGLHLLISGGQFTAGTVTCKSILFPDKTEELKGRTINPTDIKVEGISATVITGTQWLADPVVDAVLSKVYEIMPDAQIESTSTGKWVLTLQKP